MPETAKDEQPLTVETLPFMPGRIERQPKAGIGEILRSILTRR